ncbi:hypothetical protein GQ602_001545 [Ophiocordyceps camponoti-floridani]|uniref:Uncharacterized protein n=1 Tax=Ophiocordyceps camponoti-floridani TaxID=2030778 RepID=A0A8H4VH69_9HYPO|nr:hypothetical protein GQ602_001545 [Ophiocordyceps camponoti-floridani]
MTRRDLFDSLPLSWHRDGLVLRLGGHRPVWLSCFYFTLNDGVPFVAHIDIAMIKHLRTNITWPYKKNRINPPCYRLNRNLKKSVTPKQRLRDPYLVALLIALGQVQWMALGEKTRHAAGVAPKLLLSTKKSLYLYSANISSSLLKMFENPSLKQTAPGPLNVQVFTIQLRPFQTFRSRLFTQLLSASSLEDMEEPEKMIMY